MLNFYFPAAIYIPDCQIILVLVIFRRGTRVNVVTILSRKLELSISSTAFNVLRGWLREQFQSSCFFFFELLKGKLLSHAIKAQEV